MADNAKRDENHVPSLLGASNIDGVTPVVIWADPVTHRLLVSGTGGGGVTTLNGLSGAVILAAGANITLTPVGNTITIASTAGGGTVTTVSVVTANGISGSVANPTTTPAITLTLGAITPTSINGNTITAGTGTLTLSTFTLTVAGTSSITGTNTGDQTITLTGDVTGSGTGTFATTLATVNANVGSFTSANITVNAKGLITAAANGSGGGGLTWSTIVADQTAAVNNGYVTNKASLLTLTLPAVAAVGATISIRGLGAGGWLIAQNAGQLVYFGSQVSTTGVTGSWSSQGAQAVDTTHYAADVVCIVANTTWSLTSVGNLTPA